MCLFSEFQIFRSLVCITHILPVYTYHGIVRTCPYTHKLAACPQKVYAYIPRDNGSKGEYRQSTLLSFQFLRNNKILAKLIIFFLTFFLRTRKPISWIVKWITKNSYLRRKPLRVLNWIIFYFKTYHSRIIVKETKYQLGSCLRH